MKAERHLHVTPDLLELFEQIFAASPWPMLMLSTDGSVISASDEAGAQACRGDTSDASDAPLRMRAENYLVALRGGGGPWLTEQQLDCVRQRHDGIEVHERLHLRPTAWGATLAIVDQTELQQLRCAEVQTARLASLGFMVAGVCHEVTNPLTALHSIVQILRADPDPGELLLKKGLDNIAVNVKRILDISRRLLKFSRVCDEPRSLIEVDAVVQEVLHMIRQDGGLAGIELRYQPDPHARLIVNPGQLREILLNLIHNARHAMGRSGGTLCIEPRNLGRSIEILVSDSGPGIPAELLPKIFEPFFTTKSRTEGTGLGLSICSEFAREHGGLVELRSTSAQGTTFCVTLPTGLQ